MTNESYWDQQVRDALRPAFDGGQLTTIDEVDDLFRRLESAFPIARSKIDWNKVPGSIYLASKGAKRENFQRFFHENMERMGLDTTALYLSDAALSFAIAGTVRSLGQSLHSILENPEHHYFVASDFSWCMALTMEGDMNFGFAP